MMAKPYIRPTDIKGLLAGEEQCQWSAWYKAHHYRYPKVESYFDFEAWRKQHTRLVEKVVAELRGRGYTSHVEQQNRFKVVGDAATVAGQVDIIAFPPTDSENPILVIDCKTGKLYDKDRWQVRVYMAVADLAWPELHGSAVSGQVRYQTNTPEVVVPVDLSSSDRQRVFDQVNRSAGPEPQHSPSRLECGFCNIAECDQRYSEGEAEASAGGAF